MEEHISTPRSDCPSADISPYIDGELSPARELELEMHFAVCENCAAELNLQKKFLIALDQALEGEKEIDLPTNFTKVVVTKAESRVSGLRRRSERSNAFFVCSALVVFVMFTLGADSARTIDGFMAIFEKIAAVGMFAARFAYDLAIGLVIILRSLTSHLVFSSTLSLLLPGVAALYLYILARLMALFNRF